MLPGGRIGVALFFMITGYFSINKDRIHIKTVVVETLFYAVVMSVIGAAVKENSFAAVVKSPLAIMNGDWWFVSSYIFLALCVPLINQYYKTLDIKGQALLLGSIWLLFNFLPYIFKTKYYDLIRCLPFYTAGAFLKSCVMSEENSALFEKLKKWRWAFLVSFFVI